jgi:hypothetical protein
LALKSALRKKRALNAKNGPMWILYASLRCKAALKWDARRMAAAQSCRTDAPQWVEATHYNSAIARKLGVAMCHSRA